MKFKALVAVLLTVCAYPSFAAPIVCSATTAWGSLGPPDVQNFGDSFGNSGSFTNCYDFTLSSTATLQGGVMEIDPWLNRLDIDVSAITLVGPGGSTTTAAAVDSFSFSNLLAGVYQLVVSTTVVRDLGLFSAPVSYSGQVLTVATRAPTAVPEPGTSSLLGAGLVALWLMRRRARAVS